MCFVQSRLITNQTVIYVFYFQGIANVFLKSVVNNYGKGKHENLGTTFTLFLQQQKNGLNGTHKCYMKIRWQDIFF